MINILKFSITLLFATNAFAWTSYQSRTRQVSSRTFSGTIRQSTRSSEDENYVNGSGQSRRQWIYNVGKATITPFLLPSSPTLAAPTLVSSKAVCDSTVSVWKEPNRNRLIYLLGTAHISKISADLAGQLVRDVHPNAVFVELDLKRVGGVAQYVKQKEDMQASMQQMTIPSSTSDMPMDATASPKTTNVIVPIPSSAVATEETAPAQPRGFLGGLRQRALNIGAQAVGSVVRSMYQNLGDQGFSPGEEFAAAVMEAQKQGADVILGDQDVEVTLRRLTQALASTDLSKLSDDALSDKLTDLMGSKKAMELPPSGVMDESYKEEFTQFVENMKNRENVRAIMAELKEVAPALAQVMLTERDAYMAAGLDTLNQFECIVAVMGIAHMDGVENNLKRSGWKVVAPTCS